MNLQTLAVALLALWLAGQVALRAVVGVEKYWLTVGRPVAIRGARAADPNADVDDEAIRQEIDDLAIRHPVTIAVVVAVVTLLVVLS